MMGFAERIENWKAVFLTPMPALDAENKKDKVTLNEGAENFGTAIIISTLLTSIVAMLFAGMFGIAGLIALVVALAFTVVGALIMTLVGTGIMYIIAMVLGGKTTFSKLYYMVSASYAPIAVVSGVISAIATVPFLGFLGIANILVSLYGLYLLTLSIQKTYKFEMWKAVVVWLVPMAVFIAIAMVFMAAAFMALLGGAAMGAAAAKAY